MIKIVFVITLLVQVVASDVFAGEFDKEKAVSEAKQITKTFAEALKSELVTAMKSGGPINALGVCNIEAMPITSQIASQYSANVSRVSLKNRNPNNVPNEWQRVVLEDFNVRATGGESIENMASVSVVDNNGKNQVRFMKALPTGGACLACHGQDLGSDVQAELSVLYPEDKATGYSLGEVRGAIVVVKDY